MHPLRFWSLFLALAASATVLFPRIAEARPCPSIAGDTRSGAKPRPVPARPIIVNIEPGDRAEIHFGLGGGVIVKIARPYRAEIHAQPRRIAQGKQNKGKRK